MKQLFMGKDQHQGMRVDLDAGPTAAAAVSMSDKDFVADAEEGKRRNKKKSPAASVASKGFGKK